MIKCAICDKPGYTRVTETLTDIWESCMCVGHDALCWRAMATDDFMEFARDLSMNQPELLAESPVDVLELATTLATIRVMSWYKCNEDLMVLRESIEALPENATSIDYEWAICSALEKVGDYGNG
jgi:hypothetical protein